MRRLLGRIGLSAAVVGLVALLQSGVASIDPLGVATAAPDATPVYVAGDDLRLLVWRLEGPEAVVQAYELGYADPRIGHGWQPAREAGAPPTAPPAGPYVFRSDPAEGSEPSLQGSVLPLGGLRWEPDTRRIVASGATGLTEWVVREGRVVEAVRHGLLVVPPGFETLEREGSDGGIEERTTMGPPPRTRVMPVRCPAAPEGLLLGAGLAEAAH